MTGLRSALTPTALSLGLCFGSMGVLIGGFSLTPENIGALALLWLAVPVVYGLVCHRRHGPAVLLCLAAACLGYLLEQGRVVQQAAALVEILSQRFDDAYGWGVLRFPGRREGGIDGALGLWGCILSAAVCRSVYRRKSAAVPVVLAWVFPGLAGLLPEPACPDWAVFLLLFSGAVLLLTGSVRRESPPQAASLTARITLPVLGMLAAVFLLNPADTYVNHAEPVWDALAEAGSLLAEKWVLPELPRQVDLSRLAGVEPAQRPVMCVTAEQSGPLYLRGRDYDVYSGDGWASTPRRQEQTGGWDPAERVTISTFSVEDVLYLPYYPSGDLVLEGGRVPNTAGSRGYTLIRCAQGAAADGETQKTCLALPEETRQWAGPLAARIGADPAAIAGFVRQSARYDTQTGKMPDGAGDFARWFLEESDRGYCVHFATAAAVLLRAAGIPARYVTGYLTEAKAGQTVTVTDADAHAWAEYYDVDAGCWRILEATPSAAPEAAEEVPNAPPAVSPLWLLPVGAALAMALVSRLRVALRRRKRDRADLNRRTLLWWQEARRLSQALDSRPPEALQALAEQARYSRHRLTPMDLTPFEDYCRQCREALNRKNRLTRLVNRYVRALY